mmetsp:Transcript_31318/g.43431  ORF Transcript_31318/g.43431 Transcript_31318/m.43431 type:complete len:210 (-) Transcript_31318:1070-1699(-)
MANSADAVRVAYSLGVEAKQICQLARGLLGTLPRSELAVGLVRGDVADAAENLHLHLVEARLYRGHQVQGVVRAVGSVFCNHSVAPHSSSLLLWDLERYSGDDRWHLPLNDHPGPRSTVAPRGGGPCKQASPSYPLEQMTTTHFLLTSSFASLTSLIFFTLLDSLASFLVRGFFLPNGILNCSRFFFHRRHLLVLFINLLFYLDGSLCG